MMVLSDGRAFRDMTLGEFRFQVDGKDETIASGVTRLSE